MPRQSNQRVILDVGANTYGLPYRVGSKGERHLFIIEMTGAATVAIRGRQQGGPWRELVSSTTNAEVNLEDYGWFEWQAVSSAMGVGATAKVTWSW